MANVNYQGNDFKEWWKANYGSDYDGKSAIYKKDSMNEADYSIGQKLYNSYLNQQDLTNQYNTSKETLTQNKRDAEIAADVSYQRLQKYLPQQLAKQGLYGTGMSEDAYLKLHNNYQNDVADIGKDYNANMTTLENAYRTDINDERRAVGTEVEGVIDKYKAEKIAEEERIKNNQLAMYNEAYDGLNTGYFKTVDDVNNFLAKYDGKTSESQWGILQNYANEIIDGINATKAAEEAKAKKAKAYGYSGEPLKYSKTGVNNIRIWKNNKETFDVQFGSSIGGDVKEYAEDNIKKGRLFVYNDVPYIYTNDGKVYEVDARTSAKTEYQELVRYIYANQ